MPYKRSYAPSYGRRVRRRFATAHRRKVGYRRYVRKASSIKQARPTRFGASRANLRLNMAVARTIRGMAETKLIALRNSPWQQPIQSPTGRGLAQVQFVTGTTPVPQYLNYLPVGGFDCPQGDGKANRDGQFIYLKKTSVCLTVQMDHQPIAAPAGLSSEISFRVICFKQKRANSPANQTLSPDTQLFLTNSGNNFGDSTPAPANMDPNDMLCQPINTNNFSVISDKKFTLSHTTDSEAVQKYRSYKLLRYDLNHNIKARIPLGQTDEPQNYNYRFLFAIYAYYPQLNPTVLADVPLSWSAGIRGTTTFNDV